MATAGNGITVTTATTVLYDPGAASNPDPKCRSFEIANRAGSGGALLLVNVAGLHGPGDWRGIAPGTVPIRFTASPLNIGKVQVKTDGSTATIDFSIVESE